MSFVAKIYANITKSKLCALAQESAKRYEQCKEEFVLRSKTMEELLSDKFEYKGLKPDTIYVKNLATGEPLEAKFVRSFKKMSDFIEEIIELFDSSGAKLGCKNFAYSKKNGHYNMIAGDMQTFNYNLGGVGFRLDQLHIERALQLGINSIPRQSLPEASIYHLKMGFLPKETIMDEIKSINQVKNFTEEDFKIMAKSIPLSHYKPVIVQKGAKFYIDVNKTQLLTNIDECRNILHKNNGYRVLSLDSGHTNLELSGQELEYWKSIIKQHPILEKSKTNFAVLNL